MEGSNGKVRSLSKGRRLNHHVQRHKLRCLSPEQIMEYEDNFEAEYGYTDSESLVKPSKGRGPQSERMGREVRIKQSRLLQDMELDDGYPSNKRKF